MSGRYEAVVRPEVHVVLEQGPRNWCACAPSIPGYIATGRTREEIQRNIEEALTLHLEGLPEEGLREEEEHRGEVEELIAAMRTSEDAGE